MERTPLLRGDRGRQSDEEGLTPEHDNAPGGDHPIFLRTAHSPWNWLDQNALGYVRGGVLGYMIAAGIMALHYKMNIKEDEHSNWRLVYQFSTVTWAPLILYHLMAFSWTITHMHWPDINSTDRRWESRLLQFMSPPAQTADSRRRIYFSFFYTIVHVFALLNTIHYWGVLVPNGHGHGPKGEDSSSALFMFDDDDGGKGNPFKNPFKDIISEGWFKAFCLFNIYTATSLFTFIEVFFLNSMRPQEPVPSHVFATLFATSAYLGWAAIGKAATGHYAFFWMNEDVVGNRETVAAYCIGFVFSSAGVFSFLHGLIGMRQKIANHP